MSGSDMRISEADVGLSNALFIPLPVRNRSELGAKIELFDGNLTISGG